jgi:hypothetical protein
MLVDLYDLLEVKAERRGCVRICTSDLCPKQYNGFTLSLVSYKLEGRGFDSR